MSCSGFSARQRAEEERAVSLNTTGLSVTELASQRLAARDSLVAFRSLFLRSKDDVAPMPEHFRWSDIILHGKKHFAVEAFRESAKTQLALRANIMHALTFPQEGRLFLVIIRNTMDLASSLLRDTMREWRSRPDLMIQQGGMPEVVTDNAMMCDVVYPDGTKLRIQAFGKGGSVRGLMWENKRPDLIICDDLQDLEDMNSPSVCDKDWQWYISEVSFLGMNSRIFLIGNNLGERCIIERIIRDPDFLGYDTAVVPKIVKAADGGWISSWPARYDVKDVLDQKERFLRRGMADVFFREMLCVARAPGAQPFRREMFRYHNPLAIDSQKMSVYMTVDLASSLADSADFSVCCVVGVTDEGMWLVLDVWYGRVTPSEHMAAIFSMVMKWRPITVGIEKVQYQAAMLDFLEREMPRRNVYFDITPVAAKGHKEDRISAIQPRFARGHVSFPQGAGWLQEMEGELLAFPAGVHDDLIDALAYMNVVAKPPVRGSRLTASYEIPDMGGM